MTSQNIALWDINIALWITFLFIGTKIILFIDNLFIYLFHGYVSFSFYAYMHLTMENL